MSFGHSSSLLFEHRFLSSHVQMVGRASSFCIFPDAIIRPARAGSVGAVVRSSCTEWLEPIPFSLLGEACDADAQIFNFRAHIGLNPYSEEIRETCFRATKT